MKKKEIIISKQNSKNSSNKSLIEEETIEYLSEIIKSSLVSQISSSKGTFKLPMQKSDNFHKKFKKAVHHLSKKNSVSMNIKKVCSFDKKFN